MLQPFAYECPGLSGPTSRQNIGRITFGDFLLNDRHQIVIPVFQRRYCWDEKRILAWWNDALHGKRDHLGLHNSGNIVIKKIHEKVDSSTQTCIICIDGQQRLTTTSLLCAALRDAILKLPIHQGEDQKKRKSVLKRLENVIYVDNKEISPVTDDLLYNSCMLYSKLRPSHSDRDAYFSLIVEGLEKKSENLHRSRNSIQEKAKRIFDNLIEKSLKKCPLNQLDFLLNCVHCALDKMSMTLVDIESEVNMPQVFLWLQEKGLFGEGSILFNPSPGIDFETSDLVRNLLMSIIANDTLQNQEILYKELWLDPIESKSSSPFDMNEKLGNFLKFQNRRRSIRYVSELEKNSKVIAKSMSKEKTMSIIVYSEFYSFYEFRITQKLMLPPNQVGKVQVSELADESTVYSASVEILHEFADWLKNS